MEHPGLLLLLHTRDIAPDSDLEYGLLGIAMTLSWPHGYDLSRGPAREHALTIFMRLDPHTRSWVVRKGRREYSRYPYSGVL